jgi:hypothetical protein
MFNARVFYYAGRHVLYNPDKLNIQCNAAVKFLECSVQHVGHALRNLQGATAANRGAGALCCAISLRLTRRTAGADAVHLFLISTCEELSKAATAELMSAQKARRARHALMLQLREPATLNSSAEHELVRAAHSAGGA